MEQKRHTAAKTALRVLVGVLWMALIVLCVLNRERITVDGIVSLSPGSTVVAIGLMLVLFALKSMTVVVYCGILYAACGLMFPLPLALGVSYAGTAVMVTIPFFLGRGLGHDGVQTLLRKHPKLATVAQLQRKNEFATAFLVRIMGLLPSDPISAYLGASGLRYGAYLAGTMLGMLPFVTAFTVMGTSVHDLRSPTFLIAAGVVVAASAVSVTVLARHRRKKASER